MAKKYDTKNLKKYESLSVERDIKLTELMALIDILKEKGFTENDIILKLEEDPYDCSGYSYMQLNASRPFTQSEIDEWIKDQEAIEKYKADQAKKLKKDRIAHEKREFQRLLKKYGNSENTSEKDNG